MLLRKGRSAEAETIYRELYETRSRKFGEEHPDTINALNNVALALRAQERLSEAEPLCVKTLEMRRRTFGMQHPLTWAAMTGFAGYSRC